MLDAFLEAARLDESQRFSTLLILADWCDENDMWFLAQVYRSAGENQWWPITQEDGRLTWKGVLPTKVWNQLPSRCTTPFVPGFATLKGAYAYLAYAVQRIKVIDNIVQTNPFESSSPTYKRLWRKM